MACAGLLTELAPGKKTEKDYPVRAKQSPSALCVFGRMQNLLAWIGQLDCLLRGHHPSGHVTDGVAQVLFGHLDQHHPGRRGVDHPRLGQGSDAVDVGFLRRTIASKSQDKSRHTRPDSRITPSRGSWRN